MNNQIINFLSLINYKLSPNDVNNLNNFLINNKPISYYTKEENVIYLSNKFITKNKSNKSNKPNNQTTEPTLEDYYNEEITTTDDNTPDNNINTTAITTNISIKGKQRYQDINVSSFLKQPSIYAMSNLFNKTPRYKKSYVNLDSRNAIYNNDFTKLTWDVMESLLESPNSTNLNPGVRDIIEMRFYSFVMKQFSSTVSRAVLLIDELSAQSFLTPTGNKFHFMFRFNLLNSTITKPGDTTIQQQTYDITLTGGSGGGGSLTIDPPVDATLYNYPDPILYNKMQLLSGFRYDEGKYRFNTPVNLPKNITLSLYDPFTLVPIQKDYYTNAAITINYATSSIVITLPENHTFGTGYEIYSIFLSDFTTSDTVTDANIIADINNNEFTSAITTAPNIITINPVLIRPPGNYNYLINRNVTGYGSPVGIPSTVTVRLSGYRIIYTMEFTYLDPTLNL